MIFLVLLNYYCFNSSELLNNQQVFNNPNNNINISNCIFLRNNEFNGQGGIIYVYNKEISLFINDSIFLYCSAKNEGGSIYFNSNFQTSICFLNNICSFKSWTLIGYGQFGYIQANKFFFIFSTLFKCNSDIFSSSYSTFRPNYGNQTISNINISHTVLKHMSAFEFIDPIVLRASFLTIFNNSAVPSTIILFVGNNDNKIEYLNCINNKSPDYGVIDTWDSSQTFIISNSIFINNSYYLFSSRSNCYMSINNCIISHSINDITIGSMSLSNNIINPNYNINTFIISHLNTNICFIKNFFHSNILNKSYFNKLIFIFNLLI